MKLSFINRKFNNMIENIELNDLNATIYYVYGHQRIKI